MCLLICGETADVKVTVAEDMCQCDTCIFNLSTKTPLYNASSHVLPMCSATTFDKKSPRYVAFTEGHLPCVLPIEIFSYLLSLVPVATQAGNWFLLRTLSVYFASMLTTRFCRDCNVVCALLVEDCKG